MGLWFPPDHYNYSAFGSHSQPAAGQHDAATASAFAALASSLAARRAATLERRPPTTRTGALTTSVVVVTTVFVTVAALSQGQDPANAGTETKAKIRPRITLFI